MAGVYHEPPAPSVEVSAIPTLSVTQNQNDTIIPDSKGPPDKEGKKVLVAPVSTNPDLTFPLYVCIQGTNLILQFIQDLIKVFLKGSKAQVICL